MGTMKKEAPEYINIANHFFEHMKGGGEEKVVDDVVVWTGHADYDYETEYVRADLVPQWHKVEDCLPQPQHAVLALTREGQYSTAYYLYFHDEIKWIVSANYAGKEVVAWMEIPIFNEELL